MTWHRLMCSLVAGELGGSGAFGRGSHGHCGYVTPGRMHGHLLDVRLGQQLLPDLTHENQGKQLRMEAFQDFSDSWNLTVRDRLNLLKGELSQYFREYDRFLDKWTRGIIIHLLL